MVKISLRIKATLENIEEIYTSHEDYAFLLKVKCTNCGETSDKWHDITESVTVPSKTGRSEHNFVVKCKICARENSLDIIPATHGKYTDDDQGQFKPLITFDCRGIEPVEFTPGEGWVAKVKESNRKFENIDLSEKEWADYDESTNTSVGIYEIESEFKVVK